MSEPTLVELLEHFAVMAEVSNRLDRTVLARQARSAAKRLKKALAGECPYGDAAVRYINGGSSPPITPGSPGGGTTRLTCEEYRVEYGTSKGSHCPACDPASPPTTPTCAMCNGRHVVPTSCPTMTEGCLVAHFGPCPTCGPLHPRTP